MQLSLLQSSGAQRLFDHPVYARAKTANSSCRLVNLFGIIPVLGITNCSSFKSVYFWSVSVMVQGRLWLLGIAVTIECACLMLLPSVTMSDLMLCIVPSVFFFLWICPST